jgi:GalNAc-alpha-(1->4)-GalNAc-alpha-(1->3)-diNAcBac-PP-undecaprenol alpha-1,4-N-acetyl-D-galactosaminyltransferase
VSVVYIFEWDKVIEMNLAIMLDVMGMGGSERTALILIKIFKKYENVNLTVIVFAKNDTRISKRNYQLPDNVDVNYIYSDNYSAIKKLLLTPITLYKVKKFLVSRDIDKIVSFLDYPNLINVLLKKVLNHQVFTSERKYSKHAFANNKKYMKYYLKFVYNNSDTIIVNDIDIKESLVNDFYIKSNIIVLNNLISTVGYDYGMKAKNLNKNSPIIFITVARFTDEKNTKDIIYAFSKMNANNSILQIIGDGPSKSYLKELTVNLGIEAKVEFIGQVDNVYKYLQKADVFVFSSLSEGFPNAVLEAMFAALPIVSYRFKAGITSILENGKYGVLVDFLDIDSLSQRMYEMYSDVSLREKYSKLSKIRSQKYIDELAYENSFFDILNNKYISK